VKGNAGIKLSVDFVTETSWLRLIKAVDEKLKADTELTYLIDESNQLKNILGSIVTKTNKPN